MQCRSATEKLFKKMLNISAMPLDDTFQTLSPFNDTAINKLLRQCTPLVRNCLFQLFHGFNLSSQYTGCHIMYQFKSGPFGGHIAGSMKVISWSAGS